MRFVEQRFGVAAMLKICGIAPGWRAPKRMRLPSGDQCGRKTRIGGEVNCTASFPSARAPERAFRIRYIRHGLITAAEIQVLKRTASEERQKFMTGAVVSQKFAIELCADSEEACTVCTGQRTHIADRAGRELNRFDTTAV